MKNYIMLDGKKIPISDETSKSFKDQFSESKYDLKDGDIVYFPDIGDVGVDAINIHKDRPFDAWESKSENTILRAEAFIKLQNYADKVNGEFGLNDYSFYLNEYKKVRILAHKAVNYGGVIFSSRELAEQATDHFGEEFIKLYLGA